MTSRAEAGSETLLRPRGLAHLRARLLYRIRFVLLRTPRLHEAVLALRPSRRRNNLASREAALVVEGYFRCGNTYAVAAFRVSNPSAPFAAHSHAPANIRRAVRLDLPTLVVIREPKDACVSTVIRYPYMRPRDALRDYIQFYRSIRARRSGFVVGDFEKVVSDFGSVIEQVNRKFRTTFRRYETSVSNERAVTDLIEEWNRNESGGRVDEARVARPSSFRKAAREQMLGAFEGRVERRLLRRARALYATFVDNAQGTC